MNLDSKRSTLENISCLRCWIQWLKNWVQRIGHSPAIGGTQYVLVGQGFAKLKGILEDLGEVGYQSKGSSNGRLNMKLRVVRMRDWMWEELEWDKINFRGIWSDL